MFAMVKEGSELQQAKETVCFNTDTMFDLLTGDCRRNPKDGKWYINGGLGPSVAGIGGRSGCFKSTFAGSLGTRVSAIYDSQMMIFDSEIAIIRNKERIIHMAGAHAGKLTDDHIVCLDAKNTYDLESIREAIHDLGEEKLKCKDNMVTTPFVDRKTGEFIKSLVPSVIFIDSLTEAFSREEESLMTEKGSDDSRAKTLAMLDANKKTMILRHLNRYAGAYGIELMVTAHYGQKLNLDSYTPAPKTLQYGSQSEGFKSVGSKFGFLTSPLALIKSATNIVDDAKQAKYKLGDTSPTDLNEIVVLMQRCKNNASGLTFPFVVSQELGLLDDVTHYHYLRSNKAFGMLGNNITHQSVFLPKINMTRNSFRQLCIDNPQLRRALQLTTQLAYIQTNWSASGWRFPLKVEPQRLMDVLSSDKAKYSVDRVLNSRGYWLPQEVKCDQEYLSIIDVLEFFAEQQLVK